MSDVFTRMVEDEGYLKDIRPYKKLAAAELIRIYHRRVVRLVNEIREDHKGQSHPISRLDTCEAILKALATLKKGKP